MHLHATQYLEDSCARVPDKTAWADKNTAVDYRRAKQLTDGIASFVLSVTGGAGKKPVFVCIDRSVESVALLLGVARSGNFFVPIDAAQPLSRLTQMRQVVSPVLLLYTSGCKAPPFEDLPHASYGEAAAFPADERLLLEADRVALDSDPIYCICTSGSTGTPKAVVKSHRCVMAMTERFSEEFHLDGSLIAGNQAPFDFDVSYKDIFLTLRNGGTLQILEKMLFSFPLKLIERLNERNVNTLLWSVSAIKIVSALKTFEKIKPLTIERVMFSGEIMPPKVLRDWQEQLPGAEFVNLYGPTEVAYNCAYHRVDRSYDDDERVPIGRPFPNNHIFLLQDGKEITEPGVTGELCVTGECLAMGYYNDPEQTEMVFCQNPLQNRYPQRVYKTGDLASFDEAGRLIFHGRADFQVKHMGRRVELAEVEAAALAVSGLSFVCCLFMEETDTLCLVYEAPEPFDTELTKALRERLPAYMVPGKYICLPKMPQNRTGKIDRAGLKRMYLDAEA
ncbi:MAG: AMP-binding protein [Acutalibacter sp.]|nr:AMP-binding protein [Acutalibacter sp.]